MWDSFFGGCANGDDAASRACVYGRGGFGCRREWLPERRVTYATGAAPLRQWQRCLAFRVWGFPPPANNCLGHRESRTHRLPQPQTFQLSPFLVPAHLVACFSSFVLSPSHAVQSALTAYQVTAKARGMCKTLVFCHFLLSDLIYCSRENYKKLRLAVRYVENCF